MSDTKDPIQSDQEQTGSTEERSAFFQEWKERHLAYLASKEELAQTLEEGETPLPASPRSIVPSIFRRKKARKHTLPVDKPTLPPLSRVAVAKASSMILTSLILFFLALFFISPASKKKDIEVTGHKTLTASEVIALSLISEKDYALTLALDKEAYAANIKKQSPFVQSATIAYSFPNRFVFTIEEYRIVGYVQDQAVYRPVLSSGEVLDQAVKKEEVPENSLFIQLANRELIQKVIAQLERVDQTITSRIRTIDLTPSKVTPDLLTLRMEGEHQVLVPLGEIGDKLPYCGKISQELLEPSTIDMEVGVFRYPTPLLEETKTEEEGS